MRSPLVDSGRQVGEATLLVALSAAVAGIGPHVPLTPAEADPGKPLTVMTRNLYLGTDIDRPMLAAVTAQAEGRTPEEILVALANANHAARAIVDRTDFRVRAQLLADEIARAGPDLVGLQEVALWRSGPLDLWHIGVPEATQVDYDFLRILLDDLAARGAHYTVAATGDRADVEAPSFTGSPFDATIGGSPRDVRLTIHDVILTRVDDDLSVIDSGDQVFSSNLTFSLVGTEVGFDRGYQWADVRFGTDRLRFINTHLEAFSSDLALAQAGELLEGALSPDRTNVLVCDGNSDPLDDTVRPGDSVPHSAAYDLITEAGGFTDEWLRWAPAEAGWTSGLSELVDDPTAAGFDRRIDIVFARTPGGAGLAVDGGAVTGTELADRDPATGLWPSDHGGVVLRMRGLG
jgi:endonuclease/exonuclease/phosphatase family metal-dependent hydrolase